MKRITALFLIFVLICTHALSEGNNIIIPDQSLWGISRADFRKLHNTDFTECKIGNKNGLRGLDMEIDSYTMNVFYVFDEKMNTSTGSTYKGLSKVAYILDCNKTYSSTEREQCYQTLISDMKSQQGKPDSESKSLTTWVRDSYKIEIGKGKFENYTGSKDSSVAIVITGLNIPKPTLQPTITSSPKAESSSSSESKDKEVKKSEAKEFECYFFQDNDLFDELKIKTTRDFVITPERRAWLAAMLSLECHYSVLKPKGLDWNYRLPILVCIRGSIATVAMGTDEYYIFMICTFSPRETIYVEYYETDPSVIADILYSINDSIWRVELEDYAYFVKAVPEYYQSKYRIQMKDFMQKNSWLFKAK